jgi:subtilisin-like proprotein convertase family protein
LNQTKNFQAAKTFSSTFYLFQINLSSVTKRGDISLSLTSPFGTKSIILTERPRDGESASFSGFQTWPMSSVHFWGESVQVGDSSVWKLTVTNGGEKSFVTLDEWSLTFYGTSTTPI